MKDEKIMVVVVVVDDDDYSHHYSHFVFLNYFSSISHGSKNQFCFKRFCVRISYDNEHKQI